jgi:hypothetical protein
MIKQELQMLTKLFVLLCLLSAIVVVGCSSAPKTEPATASGEKIGVPECDQFITAYDACVTSKVPEVARAQYKTAIEQWRTSWRKLAENPQTKATLAAACAQAKEQANTSMKSYGCTF